MAVPGSGQASAPSSRPNNRFRFTPPDTLSLIAALNSLQSKQPKLVNSTTHIYHQGGAFVQPEDRDSNDHDDGNNHIKANQNDQDASDKMYITSWKMSEHHYRRKDCPFPTLARGLFTAFKDYSPPVETQTTAEATASQELATADVETTTETDNVNIVGRGYDKFFNIDEVDWTTWEALEKYTQPPYELTYKSNGCLILISALNDHELMVASKHSLGTSIIPKNVHQKEDQGTAAAQPTEQQTRADDIEAEPSNPTTKDVATPSPSQSFLVRILGPWLLSKVSDYFKIIQSLIWKLLGLRNHWAKSQQRSPSQELSKNAKKKIEKNKKRSEQRKAAEVEKKRQSDLRAQGKMVSEMDRAGHEEASGPGHATMGRRWLKIHLDRKGKTEKDLASLLWKEGWSLILEVSSYMRNP